MDSIHPMTTMISDHRTMMRILIYFGSGSGHHGDSTSSSPPKEDGIVHFAVHKDVNLIMVLLARSLRGLQAKSHKK